MPLSENKMSSFSIYNSKLQSKPYTVYDLNLNNKQFYWVGNA